MNIKTSIMTIIFTGTTILVMASCGKSREDENAYCTGAWATCEAFYQDKVALARGNVWGYVDRDGEEVIDFKFDNAAAFVRGTAVVEIDGNSNLINTQGELLLDEDYHTLIRDVDDEIIIYGNEFGFGLMTEDGTHIIEPLFDGFSGQFIDGRLAVSVDGLSGYCDKTGALVITPIYETSYEFTSGLGLVQAINGKYGYINRDGQVEIAMTYIDGYSFDDADRAIVQNDDLSYSLIDKSGNPLIDAVADIWGQGPLYKVSENDAFYLYKTDGTRFVNQAYDLITIYDNYLVNVEWSEGETAHDEVILFNPEGTINQSVPYIYADPITSTDQQTYLVDESGDEELSVYSYDLDFSVPGTGIYMITDEHLVVKNGASVGVMTLTSEPETVVAFEYQNIMLLADDYGIAQKNSQIGIIDLQGHEIVPFEYLALNIYPNL